VFLTEEEAAKEFNDHAIRFGRPEIANILPANTQSQAVQSSMTTTAITPENEVEMQYESYQSNNNVAMDMTSSDASESVAQAKSINTSHAHIVYPMIKLGQICSELQEKYRALESKVSELFQENTSPLANIESLLEINEEISSLLKELQSQSQHLLPIVYKDKELKRALELNNMVNYVSEH
jgi:hypothetical protein